MDKKELRERIVELIKASKTLDAYEIKNGDTEALEYALNCVDYYEKELASQGYEKDKNKDEKERDVTQIIKESISELKKKRESAPTSVEKVAISREIRKSVELIHKITVERTWSELEVKKSTKKIEE